MPYINFFTITELVKLKAVDDLRLCISATSGSAHVTLWYSFNNFYEESIPSKDHSARVTNTISEATHSLGEYRRRGQVLEQEERVSWKSIDVMEDNLIWIVMGESTLIMIVFLAELFVIQRYVKSKEII